MNIQAVLKQLTSRVNLTTPQATWLMEQIMSGGLEPPLVAAALTALHMKGETPEEIVAFAKVMRAHATPVKVSRRPLLDTCGTGGDHSRTFNVSTAAAFVVAGAGVAVAKHGNRAATSACGSADVLEALGARLDLAPEHVACSIEKVGIGFLFARQLHTAMRHVAPIRAALGFRTVFNLLGPLTNPAEPTGQVVGVFSKDWVEPLAKALHALGIEHAYVVHGLDGLDEVSVSAPTYVAEVYRDTVRTFEVTPHDFGVAWGNREDIGGGTPVENAAILRQLLQGVPGPARDMVVCNAALALCAAGIAHGFREGAEKAQAVIESGKARQKLEEFIAFTHDPR